MRASGIWAAMDPVVFSVNRINNKSCMYRQTHRLLFVNYIHLFMLVLMHIRSLNAIVFNRTKRSWHGPSHSVVSLTQFCFLSELLTLQKPAEEHFLSARAYGSSSRGSFLNIHLWASCLLKILCEDSFGYLFLCYTMVSISSVPLSFTSTRNGITNVN